MKNIEKTHGILLGLLVVAFFIWPQVGLAQTEKVLLQGQLIDPMLGFTGVNEVKTQVLPESILFESEGEIYVIYQNPISYKEFDKILISLKSKTPLRLSIISNISTTGDFTYELEREIPAGGEFAQYEIFLHHKLFKQVDDFGIKFAPVYSDISVEIENISLVAPNFFGTIKQAWQDFWTPASYSAFTVNVIPTPQIFGGPAFVYLLSVFLVLFALLFFRKYKTKALLGLLVLWLLISFRMGYEFLQYKQQDRKALANDNQAQDFRDYGDIYRFISWLENSLPEGTGKINLYQDTNTHFPRLLQYYLYPIIVLDESGDAKVSVFYNYSVDIENEEMIADYNEKSFITRSK